MQWWITRLKKVGFYWWKVWSFIGITDKINLFLIPSPYRSNQGLIPPCGPLLYVFFFKQYIFFRSTLQLQKPLHINHIKAYSARQEHFKLSLASLAWACPEVHLRGFHLSPQCQEQRQHQTGRYLISKEKRGWLSSVSTSPGRLWRVNYSAGDSGGGSGGLQ